MNTPYLTKDKNIHVSFPYSKIIYQYDENGITPQYLIDFGSNTMPDAVFDKEKEYTGIVDYAKKKNYGFGISNFRENENYITFNFYHTMLVIYSKKTKETERINLFMSNDDNIPFFNYFAHDGNDNKLISIYNASLFKEQMDIYKTEGIPWKKVPEYVKKISRNISKTDNPLLVIYTFKD